MVALNPIGLYIRASVNRFDTPESYLDRVSGKKTLTAVSLRILHQLRH